MVGGQRPRGIRLYEEIRALEAAQKLLKGTAHLGPLTRLHTRLLRQHRQYETMEESRAKRMQKAMERTKASISTPATRMGWWGGPIPDE